MQDRQQNHILFDAQNFRCDFGRFRPTDRARILLDLYADDRKYRPYRETHGNGDGAG